MDRTNIIEVYADYIYYAIIGDQPEIDKITTALMTANVEQYVEYLTLQTVVPLGSHIESLEQSRNIKIRLDPIVEEAQAYSYSYHPSKDSHMLICLKIIDGCHIITFPRYVLVDGNDPEKGLINEFIRLSKGKLDNSLRNTIKPVAIIGRNKDVILYVSKLLKIKNRFSDNEGLNNILQLLNELQSYSTSQDDNKDLDSLFSSLSDDKSKNKKNFGKRGRRGGGRGGRGGRGGH
jgi:hypothetical protein